LREIGVAVNSYLTGAGVLDQGSQIVAIREDLAKDVSTRINNQLNTQRTFGMEGANGSTTRTLGAQKTPICA